MLRNGIKFLILSNAYSLVRLYVLKPKDAERSCCSLYCNLCCLVHVDLHMARPTERVSCPSSYSSQWQPTQLTIPSSFSNINQIVSLICIKLFDYFSLYFKLKGKPYGTSPTLTPPILSPVTFLLLHQDTSFPRSSLTSSCLGAFALFPQLGMFFLQLVPSQPLRLKSRQSPKDHLFG